MTVNSTLTISKTVNSNISLLDNALDPFQYEVVAVVANDAHINSVHDLRGSRFCHPGHGLSRHWTDILANVSKDFNRIGFY